MTETNQPATPEAPTKATPGVQDQAPETGTRNFDDYGGEQQYDYGREENRGQHNHRVEPESRV